MKVFRLLMVLIIGLSCNGSHHLTSHHKVNKTIYIDQFRLTYFRQLLNKSYNDSKAIQEIINNDNSGFTEPVLTSNDYNLIDSLTKLDNIKLIIDSTEGNRRAEGAQGKRPLDFIITKLRGKWLDSLANERYKISKATLLHID